MGSTQTNFEKQNTNKRWRLSVTLEKNCEFTWQVWQLIIFAWELTLFYCNPTNTKKKKKKIKRLKEAQRVISIEFR
jgi:hypothetical protein